jgi:hypothetical protein
VVVVLVLLLLEVLAVEVVQAVLQLVRLALLDKETLVALLKAQVAITRRAVEVARVLRG